MDYTTCCSVLGIDHYATMKEGNKAFRELALLYHPDKAGPKSHGLMQVLNEAIAVFRKKRKYMGEPEDKRANVGGQTPSPRPTRSTESNNEQQYNTKYAGYTPAHTDWQTPQEHKPSKPARDWKANTKSSRPRQQHGHAKKSTFAPEAGNNPQPSQVIPELKSSAAIKRLRAPLEKRIWSIRAPLCGDGQFEVFFSLRGWLYHCVEVYLLPYLNDGINIYYRNLGPEYAKIDPCTQASTNETFAQLEREALKDINLLLFWRSDDKIFGPGEEGCCGQIGLLLNTMKYIQAKNFEKLQEEGLVCSWINMKMKDMLKEIGLFIHARCDHSSCGFLAKNIYLGWIEAERRWRRVLNVNLPYPVYTNPQQEQDANFGFVVHAP